MVSGLMPTSHEHTLDCNMLNCAEWGTSAHIQAVSAILSGWRALPSETLHRALRDLRFLANLHKADAAAFIAVPPMLDILLTRASATQAGAHPPLDPSRVKCALSIVWDFLFRDSMSSGNEPAYSLWSSTLAAACGDIMRAYPSHGDIQCQACYVVGLGMDGGPAIQQQIIEGGGLGLVLAGMRRFEGNTTVLGEYVHLLAIVTLPRLIVCRRTSIFFLVSYYAHSLPLPRFVAAPGLFVPPSFGRAS